MLLRHNSGTYILVTDEYINAEVVPINPGQPQNANCVICVDTAPSNNYAHPLT